MEKTHGIFLTEEGKTHFAGSFIHSFLQEGEFFECKSFNPEPYYMQLIAINPASNSILKELEFLIPHQHILFVVSDIDKKNLGFHSSEQ